MAVTSFLQSHNFEKVRWVRDTGGIFVFLPAGSPYYLLTGWEACCWEWLLAGMPLQDITALSSEFLGIDEAGAAGKVKELLQGWVQNGLLPVEEG